MKSKIKVTVHYEKIFTADLPDNSEMTKDNLLKTYLDSAQEDPWLLMSEPGAEETITAEYVEIENAD